MTTRDEFEKWAAKEVPHLYLTKKGDTGEYVYKTADIAYRSWQAARAQGGQGAEVVMATLEHTEPEPIGWVHSKHLKELESGHPIRVYHQDTPVVFDSKVPVYTQPQPAVPEGWRKAVQRAVDELSIMDESEGIAGFHLNGDVSPWDEGELPSVRDELRALLSIPTTPQADGWVRCEDRVHAKCGGRVIGRMRDGDSVSCEKCGKAGHVLIDDGGIDIDWTPAGQEGDA